MLKSAVYVIQGLSIHYGCSVYYHFFRLSSTCICQECVPNRLNRLNWKSKTYVKKFLDYFSGHSKYGLRSSKVRNSLITVHSVCFSGNNFLELIAHITGLDKLNF